MCHYEGIVRSILISMLVVGIIVLAVAATMLYNDWQEQAAYEALYQVLVEETQR